MKKALYLLLACSLVSVLLNLYLSFRGQNLLFDKANTSNTLCYISEKLNCDGALSSSYSKVFGVSLSHWGMASHAFLSISALLLILQGAGGGPFFWLPVLGFSLLNALGSLVMLALSLLVLKLFCPICLGLHGLAFLSLGVVIPALFSAKKQWSSADLSFLSFKNIVKPALFFTLGWVAFSFMIHLVFLKIYNSNDASKVVKSIIMDWRSALKKVPKGPALLEKGDPKSSVKIIEFADFLCSYCKDVHFRIELFSSAHPHAHIQFYAFPLDQCENPKSTSCFLTRGAWCAKEQGQGWAFHNLVFENQNAFSRYFSKEEEVTARIKNLFSSLALDWKKWSGCLNSKQALDVQKSQLKTGESIGIKGTPTLLVNNRKIHHQYFIQTMEKILALLSKK